MNKINLNLSTHDKIGVVWGILVILVVISLGIRFFQSKATPSKIQEIKTVVSVTPVPTLEILVGSMMFNNVPKKVSLGESFTITADFAAPGKKLDGADAVVLFDPAYLEIEEIADGIYFQEYPRKTIDPENGIIKVTAYRTEDNNPIRNSITLFSLKVRSLQRGATGLDFDFQKGKTNLSNVVEKGTSRNILGSVKNTKIIIE